MVGGGGGGGAAGLEEFGMGGRYDVEVQRGSEAAKEERSIVGKGRRWKFLHGGGWWSQSEGHAPSSSRALTLEPSLHRLPCSCHRSRLPRHSTAANLDHGQHLAMGRVRVKSPKTHNLPAKIILHPESIPDRIELD